MEDLPVDPNVAASDAAVSAPVETASAEPASADSGASQTAENSADNLTFEERVEKRFIEIEAFVMKLPHSIAHAISLGSAEPEELAKRALAHLFAKE